MIEHIERLLKSRIGLEAESVGRTVIERAVRQRMSALGQQNLEGYWTTLGGSTREQQALVEAVVVPETWFFRYPESLTHWPAWLRSVTHSCTTVGRCA